MGVGKFSYRRAPHKGGTLNSSPVLRQYLIRTAGRPRKRGTLKSSPLLPHPMLIPPAPRGAPGKGGPTYWPSSGAASSFRLLLPCYPCWGAYPEVHSQEPCIFVAIVLFSAICNMCQWRDFEFAHEHEISRMPVWFQVVPNTNSAFACDAHGLIRGGRSLQCCGMLQGI